MSQIKFHLPTKFKTVEINNIYSWFEYYNFPDKIGYITGKLFSHLHEERYGLAWPLICQLREWRLMPMVLELITSHINHLEDILSPDTCSLGILPQMAHRSLNLLEHDLLCSDLIRLAPKDIIIQVLNFRARYYGSINRHVWSCLIDIYRTPSERLCSQLLANWNQHYGLTQNVILHSICLSIAVNSQVPNEIWSKIPSSMVSCICKIVSKKTNLNWMLIQQTDLPSIAWPSFISQLIKDGYLFRPTTGIWKRLSLINMLNRCDQTDQTRLANKILRVALDKITRVHNKNLIKSLISYLHDKPLDLRPNHLQILICAGEFLSVKLYNYLLRYWVLPNSVLYDHDAVYRRANGNELHRFTKEHILHPLEIDIYDMIQLAWNSHQDIIGRLNYYQSWLTDEQLITGCVITSLSLPSDQFCLHWAICERRFMRMIEDSSYIILVGIQGHYQRTRELNADKGADEFWISICKPYYWNNLQHLVKKMSVEHVEELQEIIPYVSLAHISKQNLL